MPLDASFNPAVFPWNARADAELRTPGLVNPALNDPLQALNQETAIWTDAHTGVEAWDFANPYALASTQLFDKATLQPDYGLRGDTTADVLANVMRYPGILEGAN